MLFARHVPSIINAQCKKPDAQLFNRSRKQKVYRFGETRLNTFTKNAINLIIHDLYFILLKRFQSLNRDENRNIFLL